MIVVDANVVFALVADDSVTSTARVIHATDAEWVVPALWQSEMLNALLNSVKAGHLSLETALTAIESADVLLRGRIRTCDAATILQTAHTCRLTAYDATYVVLARSLGVVFVTEDKQILRACPDVARSMRQFLEPPEAPMAVRERSQAYKTARRGMQGTKA
jgi:predicted nucleic acid-binding protein